MSDTSHFARHHLIDAVLRGGTIGHWVWYVREERFDFTDTWPESLEYEPTTIERTLEAFRALVHPDDIAGLTAAFKQGELTDTRYSAGMRMKNQAGHYKHMRITGKVVERDETGRALICSGAIEDITAELEREENRRLLLDGMPVLVGLLDKDRRLVEANRATTDFIRQSRENLIGEYFWEAPGWPLDEASTRDVREAVDLALKGEMQRREIVIKHKGEATRYVHMTFSPLYDTHNEIIGCIPTASDVTTLKEMEQQATLMMRELHHRVKNTLAIVQGLASQIMRQASSKQDAAQTLSLQLQALASAHDMLVENNWSTTSMRNIIDRLRDVHDIHSSRISASGPAVKFSQKSAIMLTLALHELRTNAIKHGALSHDHGQIEIIWSLDQADPQGFEFQWRESGGPMAEPTEAVGFGALLLLRIFPAEFRGQAAFSFESDQFVYKMNGFLSPDSVT